MTVPAAATTNPIGSLVVHPAMHVAAVIHEFEGDTYLPPTTRGYEERFAGTVGWLLAAAWLGLIAAALVALNPRRVRRHRGSTSTGSRLREIQPG